MTNRLLMTLFLKRSASQLKAFQAALQLFKMLLSGVYLTTNMAEKNAWMQSEDFLKYFFVCLCVCLSHLAVGPAQLYFVHAPQFVDVLSQLVSDLLQVERHDNLRGQE